MGGGVVEGVLDDVGQAGGGVEGGFGLGEGGAFLVDAGDGLLGSLEIGRVEDLGEAGEGEVVVVAQIEGGDGGVEEVFEESVCEGGFVGLICVVVFHVGIVAHRPLGARGKLGSAWILRMGGVGAGQVLI